MSNINLTQTDLNTSLRGLIGVEILMFLPDKNIYFPSNAVTVNTKALSYTTKLQSLLEFTSLPQANIATFENNSWILDGSFISPSTTFGGGGDSYTGYISNDMTDDNGDYETNPILSVSLSATAPIINHLSIKFAGGIDTSYPKIFKIRTYNSNTLIKEHEIDMSSQKGLPLLVAEIGDTNVNKVEFEFVGTICPHRRSRLNKIMFGKVEEINPYYLQSWKINDKVSLVADTIPTKTLTYSVINYDGDYDIDRPDNKIPKNYKDVQILFTFSMEVNNLWKYAPTKVFNLMEISSNSDNIVTFECGSLLDILTDNYDQDIYDGPRTIQNIIERLLTFSDIPIDQCLLNDFTNYEINVPLPESPVREIIQKLAFSCGATLTIDDDNRIVFSKKNIVPTAFTSKFMFNRPVPFDSAAVLLQEPEVEALDYTKNIAMYTFDSTINDETSEVATLDISTNQPIRISYPAISGSIQFDQTLLEEQNATVTIVDGGGPYSQHAIIQVSWPQDGASSIKLKIIGKKVETTQTLPRTIDMNTLLLNSNFARTLPDNLKRPDSIDVSENNTFYYDDWYGAKFKYKCKTRNEFLVKAGDIIYLEVPYSNGKPSKVGYVLSNSYSETEDSGEMEVIIVA